MTIRTIVNVIIKVVPAQEIAIVAIDLPVAGLPAAAV